MYSPTPVTCIDDLRLLAKRRVPRMLYDYVDSGSWSQITYRANETDFHSIRLRQRVGRDVENRSTATTILGMPFSMPVAIAPTGVAGFLYPDGEMAAARAAAACGVAYGQSILSTCSVEAVRSASPGEIWLQVSVMKDWSILEHQIRRAREAQCSALILTIDFHIEGQRHVNIKNGLAIPPPMTPSAIADFVGHPRWLLSMLRARHRDFGNFTGSVKEVKDLRSFARWYATEPYQLDLRWDVLQRVRDMWPGKLIIKGVLDPEDAREAVRIGADAISVSNLGGRQMDSAPSSIEALPYIAEAVGSQIEVLLDGGIRTGQDILKAVASGAKGVMVGRAALYGLAADGEKGVKTALDILHKELDRTMASCGITSIDQATRDILWRPRQSEDLEP
ncbi:alpha-hydroxy acid oxidase [Rhizobium bangladeshense]|uniref:alpha-hydroxy acid oxidase n=1 Tax=Rhizobium bangladeshense TaxID=1138189 RepID=UPI0007E5764E|nr:alpha-hydroxy acid oxidase [Rhizobium bangladeshense]